MVTTRVEDGGEERSCAGPRAGEAEDIINARRSSNVIGLITVRPGRAREGRV